MLLLLSALFPIVNPLGGSPIFLALTGEYSPEGRKALSRQIAVNSFFLLIGSYFIGTYILAFFGISLPVVQVGGGLVVISNGWIMLQRGEEGERGEVGRNRQPDDPLLQAFYPLTLPLTVGPGSISVAITLGANSAHRHPVDFRAILAAVIASALIALSIFLCYRFSERLAHTLGATAMSVILRLSSFLLVCIGVQILWNGISALLSSLLSHAR
ncbi:MAG TPA: MarC family protein [Candidatus Angelobacter sp.]|nr:MarC family protein [Candidatus Angelobacter sp.]